MGRQASTLSLGAQVADPSPTDIVALLVWWNIMCVECEHVMHVLPVAPTNLPTRVGENADATDPGTVLRFDEWRSVVSVCWSSFEF